MAAFEGIRQRWRAQSRVVREVVVFLAATAFGIFVMPFVIHAVGREALGEYTNGGAADLLRDFLGALGRGARAFWAVALGPYIFLMIGRFVVHASRSAREADAGQL